MISYQIINAPASLQIHFSGIILDSFLLWLFSVRYSSTRSVACMIFETARTFKQPTWCWWCFISLILYLRITWRHCKHSCWPDTVKLWYNSQWFHTFCIHTLSFGGLIVMFGNCYCPTILGLFNYYLLIAVNQSINLKNQLWILLDHEDKAIKAERSFIQITLKWLRWLVQVQSTSLDHMKVTVPCSTDKQK